MTKPKTTSRMTRKIAAIATGVLVVGVGASYTLATWNDSEWVWGGASNQPGVGTDIFEVNQNTTSPFTDDTANWTNRETNPGGELTFTTGALHLSPGDTIYAPVALRTESDSVAATTVTLQKAVAADSIAVDDPDGDLWKSIDVAVYTENVTDPEVNPTNACDAASIDSWGTAITGVTTLDTVATDTQALAAEAGSTQHYCFVLHLPSTLKSGLTATHIDQLQGRTIAPAWEFKSVSN